MSTTIFFIAVQCCQCSTMQVKQRRKNSKSNKWTCVVCNQNQSIRNVFAQGPMAKDLRLFVQSFNMSRQFSSDLTTPLDPPSHSPPPPEEGCKRPRTDWTEFLDFDEEIGPNEGEDRTGFDDELEIVTELPMGFLKKAKLNNEKDGDQLENGGFWDKLVRPGFSKRKISQDKEKPMMNHDLKSAMEDTSESSYKSKECNQKRRTKGKGRESSSKWSSYLIEEDDVPLPPHCSTRKMEESLVDLGDNIFQTLANEEIVEDDEIHPDFLLTSV